MRSFVLVLVVCVGCAEGSGPEVIEEPLPDPPSLEIAKHEFDTNVFPIINAKCSGRSCHTAGSFVLDFVAVNAVDAYERITGSAVVGDFTTSAPILMKVKDGTHKGIAYTAVEQVRIIAWLDTERRDRQ
jgi:hypothetical protein